MNKQWRELSGLIWLVLTVALVAPKIALGEQRFPVIFDAEERAVLSAERAGVLTSLLVDVGDRVKRGEILASVYTADLSLSRKAEQLNVDFLKVQLENLQRLNKRGLATDEEVAKTSMESGSARVRIGLLSSEINRSQIRAPFTGIVVQRLSRAHEWMTEGKAVVEVLNPDLIRIVANLPSEMVVNLKPEMKHRVFVPVLNLEVEAVLTKTVPAVDEQSNTIGVIWQVKKPPPGLLAGMKGELSL